MKALVEDRAKDLVVTLITSGLAAWAVIGIISSRIFTEINVRSFL